MKPFFQSAIYPSVLIAICLQFTETLAANYPPNIDYGQRGDFITKRGVEHGRTAILAPLGPILLNLPEGPGSSNKNVNLNVIDTAWNLEDLTNPRLISAINCDDNGQCYNGQGVSAHAVVTHFDDTQAYLRGNFEYSGGGYAYYDENQPTLSEQILRTNSVASQLRVGLGYASLTSFYFAKDYWEYNTDSLDDHQMLTRFGTIMQQADIDKLTALGIADEFPVWVGPIASDAWDHIGLTGVTGFPVFSGNLLVIASDQQNTGLAIYDIGNIDRDTAPTLLNVYDPQVLQPNGDPIGIGGYWSEPYAANKIVFSARRTSDRAYPAFYVVDFEDPSAPKLTCEIYFDQDRTTNGDGDFHSNAQYVNFQDQYAYVDHFKVDIEGCETAYAAAKANNPNHIFSASELSNFVYKFDDTSNFCDSSQYFRPLGQVGVFGGYDLGPNFFVTLDSSVPAEDLGYYQWYVSLRSDTGGSLSSAHPGNVYGVSHQNADWQVGDELRGPGDRRYTITSIEQNSANTNFQGMCFFVTDDQPDTHAPYVSGHRPLANQTNVPTSTFIHVHIPETLRSESVINAVRLTRLDNDAEVTIQHQLSHTGTLTIFPMSELALDTSYRVEISGIQDFMGNTMTPYEFSFSTGDNTPPPPPPPPSDEPAPTFSGTPYYPNQSNQLSCSAESETDNIWAVNPDNNSVSVINTTLSDDFELSYEITRTIESSYRHPSSITKVDNRYAVTYRDSDRIVFYDQNGAVVHDMSTGYGTQPVSSVSDGLFLYVALYRAGVHRSGQQQEVTGTDFGKILKIDLTSYSTVAEQTVGPTPKGMALRDNRLLVTRFISPATHAEVYDLSTNDLSLTRTIRVNKIAVPDDLDHGSGVPNFLNSIVISPDGDFAHLVAIKQNVDTASPDDDNTIRPMAAIIDLSTHQDININPTTPDGTLDFDNAADPQFVSYLANGDQVVAFQGNNNVRLFDNQNNTQAIFNTAFGPQASCATLRTLYVKAFTDRTVTAIDVSKWMHDESLSPKTEHIRLVSANEDVLSVDELAGLKLFYHSEQPMFGQEGYISCASCHIGGGHDGQVWNMTRFGEGMRNTLSLNGQSGTRFGNLHWTANFDEVQDFVFQIINMNGGTADVDAGFDATRNPLSVSTSNLSTKMDQLAAYIESLGKDSLQRSPIKAVSNSAAGRGEQIFYDRDCASCHAPPAFTDGQRHDIGTGLFARTPRLSDLADSRPYLHNGSANVLSDVFTIGTTHVSKTAGLSAQQRSDLLTYLLALDKNNFISDNRVFTGLPSWIGQFGVLIELPDNEEDWVTCAQENEVCEVPENATIRYGANGVYHYIHGQSGSINCGNNVFGDAIPGAVKQCQYVVIEPRQESDELCIPIKTQSGKVALICL